MSCVPWSWQRKLSHGSLWSVLWKWPSPSHIVMVCGAKYGRRPCVSMQRGRPSACEPHGDGLRCQIWMTPMCQHATSRRCWSADPNMDDTHASACNHSRRCWSAISMQRGMQSGSPAVASSPATGWTPPSKASVASCRESPANKGRKKRRVEHGARRQHARREAISMQ